MKTNQVDMKDASGFGLLSTVIAMGIASILIVSIMDLLAMSASAQRGIQIKADRGVFLGNLTNILLQDPTCTPSLKGADVTQPLVMRDPANASVTVAQPGMHFQSWDISSLELKNQRSIDPAMNLYSADAVITLAHPHKIVGLTRTVTKQIATIYYTATDGTITHCFGATNWASVGKNYCWTMGGSWSDSAIQCSLPTVASGTTVASADIKKTESHSEHSEKDDDDKNDDDKKNGLTVSQVVASATDGKNTAVNGTPAANVITGKR